MIQWIPVTAIRSRSLGVKHAAKVAALVAAAESGTLDPIELRREGDHYTVREGRHRLEAARAAGIPLVAAVVTVSDPEPKARPCVLCHRYNCPHPVVAIRVFND